jgi:biopolymer transport protein ExbD
MRRRVHISKRRPVDEPEIVVIPMIDVMMFLLIFFMVASLAMVVQNALPVNLPKASTGEKHPPANVTITLMADGRVYINTTPTTVDKLHSQLTALDVGPKTLITLNADARVPTGTLVSAMDEGRLAGATSFGFATNK